MIQYKGNHPSMVHVYIHIECRCTCTYVRVGRKRERKREEHAQEPCADYEWGEHRKYVARSSSRKLFLDDSENLPQKQSYWKMTCFWYSKSNVFIFGHQKQVLI